MNLLIVKLEVAMKNIQDVLREKETEVEKLTREVKLLRAAARLLEDESSSRPLSGATVPPAADGDVSQSWH